METPVFLEFVRLVIDGDRDRVAGMLAAHPALARTPSPEGATRQAAKAFFFESISHYLYAGDTALHMAAAAFRRPMAELLLARGADVRARNRRGAEPLHYAADANHWDPVAQADIIGYLVSVGADPDARDGSGVAPLHRAVRTRSEAAVRALLEAGAAGGRRQSPATKQDGLDPLAPGGSNRRKVRQRFGSGPSTTGRHYPPPVATRRHPGRRGLPRQAGRSGGHQRMDPGVAPRGTDWVSLAGWLKGGTGLVHFDKSIGTTMRQRRFSVRLG